MKTQTKLNFTLLVFLLILTFAFQACSDAEKESDITEQERGDITTYSTLADNTVDEETQLLDNLLSASTGGRVLTDECAVVTKDAVSKTITIDFGSGCTGLYGRKRSGKIVVKYSGTFDDKVANRIITFDNFFVDNRKIAGTIELRDFNRNNAGYLTATRKVANLKVTFPDGNNFTLNGAVTREWIEGEGDKVAGNEVIRITGSYTGVSTRGRSFTRNITEPIIANFNCRASGGFLRVKGVEEVVFTGSRGSRSRTINYGAGNCDNEINVIVNGNTYTITAN